MLAKRYLTFKEPGYYEGLSDGSKRTLGFQGGLMDAKESAVFEQDPLYVPVFFKKSCPLAS